MDTNTTDAPLLEVLQDLIAGLVKRPRHDIDVDQPLLGLGMHSLQALLLFTQMAKQIEFRVSMTDMLRAPTLRALAETLGAAGVGPEFGDALRRAA